MASHQSDSSSSIKIKKRKLSWTSSSTSSPPPSPCSSSSNSPSSPLSVNALFSSSDAEDDPPPPPPLTSSAAVADLIAWASEAAHRYHVANEGDGNYQHYTSAHDEYLKAVEAVKKLDDPTVDVALVIADAIAARKELPLWTALTPDTSPATSQDSSGSRHTPYTKNEWRQLAGFVEPPVEVEDDDDSDGEATVESAGAAKAKDQAFVYKVLGCPACHIRMKRCPQDCMYSAMCKFNGQCFDTNLKMYKGARNFMAGDHDTLTLFLQGWGLGVESMNRLLEYLSDVFFVRGKRMGSKEEAEALCQLEGSELLQRIKECCSNGCTNA